MTLILAGPSAAVHGLEDGVYRLHLPHGLAHVSDRGTVLREVHVDLSRRDGAWEEVCWAWAKGVSVRDQRGSLRIEEQDGAPVYLIDLPLLPDQWFRGGHAQWRVQGDLTQGEIGYTGRMTRIAIREVAAAVPANLPPALRKKAEQETEIESYDEEVAPGRLQGTGHVQLMPLLPLVPGHEPPQAGEHPRLFFRAADLPALRERCRHPAWRELLPVIGEHALSTPPVYTSVYGAMASYQAGSLAMLWQLTADERYRDRALAMIPKVINEGQPAKLSGDIYWTHSLTGMALCYDMLYEHIDVELRQQLQNWLFVLAERLTLGRGKGFNHASASNWSARCRGAAGIAWLALLGDRGVDQTAVRRYLEDCERRALWYFARGMGDGGMGSEGDGYHLESVEYLFAYLHCHRTVTGRDLLSLPRLALPLMHYRQRSLGAKGSLRCYRWGRHGETWRAFPEVLYPLAIATVPPADRAAVAHDWQANGPWANQDDFFIFPWAFMQAPVELTPEDRPYWPAQIIDEQKGYVALRHPVAGPAQAFFSANAKADRAGGWNFPEAGSFRLFACGQSWTSRRKDPDDNGRGAGYLEHRVSLAGSKPKGFGRLISQQVDGSQALVQMDLTGVHRIGKEPLPNRHRRSLAVDLAQPDGAAVLVLADQVEGEAELIWQLGLPAEPTVAGQTFSLIAENGASLRGEVLVGGPAAFTVAGGLLRCRPVGGSVVVAISVVPAGVSAPAVVLDGEQLSIGTLSLHWREGGLSRP